MRRRSLLTAAALSVPVTTIRGPPRPWPTTGPGEDRPAGDFDKTYPTDTRPMKYVRSTDDGKTWQSSATLTGQKWAIAPLGRADNMNEIYMGQLRYEPATRHHPERVGIVYTLAGGGPEGHLHDRYHRNVYYTAFSPRDLHFRSADGTDLGVSIDDADQERHLRIVETSLQAVNPRSPDYISLVGTTVDALPFVLWMQIDPPRRSTPTPRCTSPAPAGRPARSAPACGSATWNRSTA
jgi:hypothetical protein